MKMAESSLLSVKTPICRRRVENNTLLEKLEKDGKKEIDRLVRAGL